MTNIDAPPALVIEYRKELLVVRAGFYIALAIGTFVSSDIFAFSDVGTRAFYIVIIIVLIGAAMVVIRKIYIDTALKLTDEGARIHGENLLEWNSITRFRVVNISNDGDSEKLVIKTTSKTFGFYIDDLKVDRRELGKWTEFYKKRRWETSEN